MALEAADCVRPLTLGTTKDCGPAGPVEMEKLTGVVGESTAPGNGFCKTTVPTGAEFDAVSPIEPMLNPELRMAEMAAACVSPMMFGIFTSVKLYDTVTLMYEPGLVGKPPAGTCKITVPSGAVNENV